MHNCIHYCIFSCLLDRWAEEINRVCGYLTDAGIKKMLVHKLIDPRYVSFA